MRKRYTKEQIDYLRKIADKTDIPNKEITRLFNKKFNLNATVTAIIGLKSRNKIKTYTRVFTEEQLEYLREITPGRSCEEIRNMYNKKYNDNRTLKSINSIRKENNILTGNSGRFEKGSISPNTRPIGSERLWSKDGYTLVKVNKSGPWKNKHVIIWEKENGPVPEGYVIMFGDGDKNNLDINNLLLVSKKQRLGLNRNNLIQDSVELTKVAINIVNLNYKISEVSKR